jgi:hypothetical protein
MKPVLIGNRCFGLVIDIEIGCSLRIQGTNKSFNMSPKHEVISENPEEICNPTHQQQLSGFLPKYEPDDIFSNKGQECQAEEAESQMSHSC